MNNLTSTLLTNNYHYQIEEWGKQGNAMPFDSGIEQRVVSSSIPAIDLTISYNGLSWSDYELIRTAYEDNNSNTFIVDLNDETSLDPYMANDYLENQTDYVFGEQSRIDMRPDLMTINAAVWAFKDFQFRIDANTLLYSGRITLVSSVFFNFDEYQDQFNQSSSYTRSESSDQSFVNLLNNVQPYSADLKYINNAIFSNIGQSVRHARNKGGLKRAWTLYWLISESQFLSLIQFYRKNSGIMGEFGFPDYGTNIGILLPYMNEDYLENQKDYVVLSGSDNLSNSRFMQDSFQYQKRVDSFYQCQADFIEVKL